MKYNDPFLGEIILSGIFSTTRYDVYVDVYNNYYMQRKLSPYSNYLNPVITIPQEVVDGIIVFNTQQ